MSNRVSPFKLFTEYRQNCERVRNTASPLNRVAEVTLYSSPTAVFGFYWRLSDQHDFSESSRLQDLFVGARSLSQRQSFANDRPESAVPFWPRSTLS